MNFLKGGRYSAFAVLQVLFLANNWEAFILCNQYQLSKLLPGLQQVYE